MASLQDLGTGGIERRLFGDSDRFEEIESEGDEGCLCPRRRENAKAEANLKALRAKLS